MVTTPSPTLIILDLPTKALCGLDQVSFNVSAQFKGVKDLPPGWHFLFVGASDSYSIRHGTWFHVPDGAISPSQKAVPQQTLIIRKWDQSKEELVEPADSSALLYWRANLGSIWNTGLIPYEKVKTGDAQEDWPELTSRINTSALSRILGASSVDWTLTSASSAAVDLDDIPGLLPSDRSEVNAEKELNFLPIDLKKQTWREGATGRERTDAALDRSWYLKTLVTKYCPGKPEDIIAEMQFCFLMVLLLNNWSCLEQWKRILELVFTCKSAVVQHIGFFTECIQLLQLQLRRSGDVETGLFDFADEGAQFLKVLLRKFKQSVQGIEHGAAKSDILDELEELEGFLLTEFNWNLDAPTIRKGMLDLEDGERVEMDMNGVDDEDDDGDYAPTIVELTPEQVKLLYGDDVEAPTSEMKHLTINKVMPEEVEEEASDIDLEDMDERY